MCVFGSSNKINLCDDCINEIPTCTGDPVFGCDTGGLSTDDNVVACDSYQQY